MLPTKNEHGEIIEIVNWKERFWEWDWAAIYDQPWLALLGDLRIKEVRDRWEQNKAKRNRVLDQWKDGDIIIYNPDWTVKEWIKGDLYKQNDEQSREVQNEQ